MLNCKNNVDDSLTNSNTENSLAAAAYVNLLEHFGQETNEGDAIFGRDYNELTRFLKPARLDVSVLTPQEIQDRGSFAWIYELNPRLPIVGRPLDEYVADNPNASAEFNHLLFLSGYPSPGVLAELGWRYGIDPEYFDRHLSFLKSNRRRDGCRREGKEPDQSEETWPVIPTLQRNIFQTAIVSIGAQDGSYETTATKRHLYTTRMGAYYHNLTMGEGWKPHRSIVRRVDVHDNCHFSLEQAVTLLMARNKRNSEKWVGAYFSSQYIMDHLLMSLKRSFGKMQELT